MSSVTQTGSLLTVAPLNVLSSNPTTPQSDAATTAASATAPASLGADLSALQQIVVVNKGALQLLASSGRVVNNVATQERMQTLSEGVTSSWDTGMQVITELTLRTGSGAVPEMIKYICSQQNSDGGWSDSVGDKNSGVTASLVNHAALVLDYEQCLASGNQTHFALVDDALKKSWQHWTGKVPSAEKILDPLPIGKVLKAAPFGLMYYFNVFPPITTRLPFGKLLAALLPSPQFVSSFMKKRGMMPQLQDFVYGAALYLMPQSSLGTHKMQAYEKYLLETRGENGLFCYLPMLTGLAVMALNRSSGNNPKTQLLIQESLAASRELQMQGADGVRVSAYQPDTIYSIDYVIASLLDDPRSLATDDIQETLNYILASRATDGNFHQMYRGDEAEDGLLFMTGKVLQLTGFLNYIFAIFPELGESEKNLALLQRFNVMVPGLVGTVGKDQNKDGGFATFRKTDLSKPSGAMEDMSYDTSTAIATAAVVSGLAAIGQNQSNSKVVQQATEWLLHDFKPGAGWWSRFGGGYLSGSATVIPALKASGIDVTKNAQVQEVVALLRARQNTDGGWGETRSTDYPKKPAEENVLRGPSHPQLTAYGIMALLDAGVSPSDPQLFKAVQYLVQQFQDPSLVLQKLATQQPVTLAEKDRAGWDMPYGTTTFSPPQWGWYVADQTLGDLHPILALQKFLMAVGQK